MKEIQLFSLLLLAGLAVLFDLRNGKIPNCIIVTGLGCGAAYQVLNSGPAGILLYSGGILLPVLIFGLFYYFRMIGAGDIKLICMLGGFLGPAECFTCIAASIFIGGVISVGIMLYHRSIYQRLFSFSEYVRDYLITKQWKPYLKDVPEQAKISFSVPVLLGTMVVIGGMI